MFWHGEARVVVAWVWWKSRTGHGPWGPPLSQCLIFVDESSCFFGTLCSNTMIQCETLRETSRVYFGDMFIWVFPKIVVPPNHPNFNSVFHYFHHPFWGNYPYFLVQHPYISTHAVWVGWGCYPSSGGAHLLGSFLGRCNMVHGCSRLCQEVVSWQFHHRIFDHFHPDSNSSIPPRSPPK